MESSSKHQEKHLEIVSVPADEKGTIEIIPFGTDERIRLSVAIVQKMIAVPTRSGKIPDANACIKFMMLCRARHLNPFEGDAYMLGYDTQSGPQFSLITAHQVFLKRAEASQGFDGMESGVIVKGKLPFNATGVETQVEEREGDIVYDNENLIGGWAKVYRKNVEKPFYRRLKLETFNTGRSRWEKDPAGMVVKCAEADALRTAFPTHLGGLYLQEETEPIDVGPVIGRAKITKISAGDAVVHTSIDHTEEHNEEERKPTSPAENSSSRNTEKLSGVARAVPTGSDTPETSGESISPAQSPPKKKTKPQEELPF